MKKLFLFIGVMFFLAAGCATKLKAPVYGEIESSTDSHIFVYTDADVDVRKEGVKSDDTTVIIVGVKDNSGADLKDIFNNALSEIQKIFGSRASIYRRWVDEDGD